MSDHEPTRAGVRPRLLDMALLVVSLIALGLATLTSVETIAYAHCQAGVDEALIVAQVARAAAANQDRQSDRAETAATGDLIQAVFGAKTQPQVLQAYASYRATLATINRNRALAEAERQAHPLPDPPSETC